MKKVNNLLVLALASSMIFSSLAGCGKTKDADNNKSSGSPSSQQDGPLGEKMEISIAHWDIGGALPEGGKEDLIKDEVFKKLNISIKPVNITWDDYTQKIQVWAASDQLPDAFSIDAISTNNFKTWITQGIVRALPDDLSPYPNLKKIVSDPTYDAYKYPMGDPNGKYYCIPRANYIDPIQSAGSLGLQIRKDWMEKVGITKEPTNMDELIELMKAFVEKDPDGNGKKDTIGLTLYNPGWLGFLMLGYEPGASWDIAWVRDKENPGKWIPGWMTKDFLEGMKAIKKLYDAGGLDKDFATIKGTEGIDKYASGKAGAFAHQLSLTLAAEKFERIYPDKKYEDVVVTVKPFKHYKDNNYYYFQGPSAWSELYISAKVNDKKTDRIMRLAEYFMTEEGYNLTHFGIEGKDWKNEGGKVVLTPQKDADGKAIPITTLYPFTKAGNLVEWSGARRYITPSTYPQLIKKEKDMLDWYGKSAKPMDSDPKAGFVDYPSKDKATAKLTDIWTKCILSDDVEKTWNDLVKSYMANGYDKVIKDYNDAAAKIGLK